MSAHAKLYRAMLKQGQRFDGEPWRRALLLSHPSLMRLTAGLAAQRGHGHALLFLQPSASDAAPAGAVQLDADELNQQRDAKHIQQLIKQQFRHAHWRSVAPQQSLTRGFELLRCMRAANDTLLPSAVPGASLSAASRTAEASAVSSSTASSKRVVPPPLARVSALGRLHTELDGAQPKPKTPTAPADQNKDSGYDQAVTQATVMAGDYLTSLASSSSSSTAAAGSAQDAAPSAISTGSAGFDVFLLEQSRLRHAARAWGELAVTQLDAEQQNALEALVLELGTGVQSGSLERVLAFQQELTQAPQQLQRFVLSNTAVLDAWVDFLYGAKAFGTLCSLQRQRLSAGVDTVAFSLSRNSMAKMLAACAVEGDASTSLMLLRESSWGSLAKVEASAAAGAVSSAVDNETVSFAHPPTSVNRLPSWTPRWWGTEQAMQSLSIVRARTPEDELALEELCDGLLAAAGQGFGAEDAVQQQPAAPAPVSVSAPILAPKPSHPRLSINLGALQPRASPQPFRAAGTPLAALQRSSSSSLLSHATAGGSTPGGAGISTRARAYAAPAMAQAVSAPEEEAVLLMPTPAPAPPRPVTPPTPLPILDLFTELSVDSRLMELALVAAVRQQARAAEFARRDAVQRVLAHAQANPDLENADVNLALHQQAQELIAEQRQQQQQSPRRNRRRRASRALEASIPRPDAIELEKELEPDDVEDFGLQDEDGEEQQPRTLFDVLNDPVQPPPMAFQLWSLMLQQQVPLQHSSTFVHLLSSLQAHVEAMGAEAGSAPSLLLATLSREMAHSRGAGGVLQHKWLRADEAAFRQGELSLHLKLAMQADPLDTSSASSSFSSREHVWESVDLLRLMHAEGLPPPSAALIAQVYRMVLLGGEAGYARTKLLQDLLLVVEDMGCAEAVLEEIAAQAE